MYKCVYINSVIVYFEDKLLLYLISIQKQNFNEINYQAILMIIVTTERKNLAFQLLKSVFFSVTISLNMKNLIS